MRTPFFPATLLLLASPAACFAQSSASAAALRFFGTGVGPPGQQDRVRIQIDDDAPGPDASAPCDVGAGSFTVEFWVRGLLGDNTTGNAGGDNECFCNNWIDGNIIVDRDIYDGSNRDWGISIAGGFVRFGVGPGNAGGSPDNTIEGDVNVLNGQWHHVACVRDFAVGQLRVYVDGALDFAGSADVNFADISYPDSGDPGQVTVWGPYIVLGAEKHDAGAAYPSFNGFMDEFRVWSRALSQAEVARLGPRVLKRGSPPAAGLAASYRFEEGTGVSAADTSGAGSPTGEVIAGVAGNGEWVSASTDPSFTAPVSHCAGDADGDLTVSFSDVTAVLANFGLVSGDGLSIGDADSSGAVNFGDATAVLANFGAACP